MKKASVDWNANICLSVRVCLCLSLILNLLEQWHSVPVIEMASYIVVICVYNTLHSSHYTSEHFAEIRREREKNTRRENTRKRFSTAQKLSFKLSSTANFFYHSFWPFYLSFLFFFFFSIFQTIFSVCCCKFILTWLCRSHTYTVSFSHI